MKFLSLDLGCSIYAYIFGNMINSEAMIFSNNSELLHKVKIIAICKKLENFSIVSRIKWYMKCKISKHRIMHAEGKQKKTHKP